MLDFLEDLRMCPDSSFEMGREHENLMQDFLEPHLSKPFPILENGDD